MNNSTENSFIIEEYKALKAELLLRIAIQNMTILTAVVAFSAGGFIAVLSPANASNLAFMQSMITLALALQWCHQGVRQCPLKQAILAHDKAAGRTHTWESWLPAQRPSGFLGSRWFVSTKGVFIGLNAIMILFAAYNFGAVLLLSCITLAITTVVLMTNPKE